MTIEGSFLRTIIKNISHIEIQMKKIKPYIDAFSNKNRIEILVLLDKKGKMSITDIANAVGMAYKNVHAHIKLLESLTLVIAVKQEKSQGRKVYVDLSPEVKKAKLPPNSPFPK